MISGFRASDIGQYGIEDLSWWKGPGGYQSFSEEPGYGTQSPFFQETGILIAVERFIDSWFTGGSDEPRARLPSVLSPQPGPEASLPPPEVAGPQEVLPQEEALEGVIDPNFRKTYTVHEDVPGGIYEVDREPTDWDEYYRKYEILNRPPEVEEHMFDWITTGVQDLANIGNTVGWWGGDTASAGRAPQYPVPGQLPAKVTVDTRTGKVTPCKRRRRRKLLTESDFNVLLRVATLPNKENVRIVLGKAIGRS